MDLFWLAIWLQEKKKSRKVKEEVDKGRNLAQGKNRGEKVQCGKRGSSGVFKG